MERELRITTRSALLATAMTAIWCALFAAEEKVGVYLRTQPFNVFAHYCYVAVLLSLPALAAGTLVGHWCVGALCAIASALALFAVWYATIL